MKILTIGLDSSICDTTSALFARVQDYAAIVEQYDVVVPSSSKYRLDQGNLTVVGTGGATKIIQLWRIFVLALNLQQQHQSTVISCQDIYYLGFVAIILGAWRNVGVEIQVHGFERCIGIRRWLARLVLRRATGIRVVSENVREQVIKLATVEAQRIVVVPIFVDWQAIEMQARQVSSVHDLDTFVFVTVGRMVPVKRIDQIIIAFATLYKHTPHCHLRIVGDGPLRAELVALVAQYELQNAVTFVGWVTDVIAEYAVSDCSVFFSKSEGYGMACVESLACGVPVVTTPVGIASEIVLHRVNGFIIDRDDTTVLADTLSKIVLDAQLFQSLRQHTRDGLHVLPTRTQILQHYLRSWRRCEK